MRNTRDTSNKFPFVSYPPVGMPPSDPPVPISVISYYPRELGLVTPLPPGPFLWELYQLICVNVPQRTPRLTEV